MSYFFTSVSSTSCVVSTLQYVELAVGVFKGELSLLESAVFISSFENLLANFERDIY